MDHIIRHFVHIVTSQAKPALTMAANYSSCNLVYKIKKQLHITQTFIFISYRYISAPHTTKQDGSVGKHYQSCLLVFLNINNTLTTKKYAKQNAEPECTSAKLQHKEAQTRIVQRSHQETTKKNSLQQTSLSLSVV